MRRSRKAARQFLCVVSAMVLVGSCSGDSKSGPTTAKGNGAGSSTTGKTTTTVAAPVTDFVLPGAGARPSLNLGPGERPNVLVIMTDDQTVESMRHMPKVQSLLTANGLTFDQSIVTYPLCCPSRASFFTAQYSHNNGVEWNSGANGGYASFKGQDTAVPAALQANGYRTSHIGKFLNGYGDRKSAAIPKGWDNFQGLAGPSTGQYFQFTINDNGVLRPFGPNDYQTDVLTELAVKDIETAAAGDQPFFLSLAYLAPHAQFGCPLAECTAEQIREEREFSNIGFGHAEAVPAPRDEGSADGLSLPDVPSLGELSTGGSTADGRPPLSETDMEDLTNGYRSEVESLKAVDDGVESIVKALERTGQLDKTLVVYTSDNGYYHGEHRLRYGKYLPYEEALRVPLVVRGPGVVAGTTNKTVVTNVDLATTIMSYTQTAPLREPDGLDLSPLFADEELVWDRGVLVEGLGPQSVSQPQYLGMRTKRWAYFEFSATATGDGASTGGRELYDLDADPYQLTNLADAPEYADVVGQLSAAVGALTLCAGIECAEAADPTK